MSQKSALRTRVPLWLSPLTRKLPLKVRTRYPIVYHTGIHRWRLSTWCPTPPPTTPLLLFSPFCAIARSPLNPAALAFVPFGIVLVRVRVRVRVRSDMKSSVAALFYPALAPFILMKKRKALSAIETVICNQNQISTSIAKPLSQSPL